MIHILKIIITADEAEITVPKLSPMLIAQYLGNNYLLNPNKDISICTNPISNLNLGCGIAKIKEYIDNGLNICLGTDGQGSGNDLNLFYHMSLVDYLQKGVHEDPTVLSSYEVLKMATINGAKALGLEDKIGSIEIGKKADLILIDLKDIAMQPTVNIITEITHNGWFDSIDTTIINGAFSANLAYIEQVLNSFIFSLSVTTINLHDC